MIIDTLVVGALEENCYIVTKNDKTIIIDPGDDAKRIIDFCKNKNVVEILVTHYHFDHIGALREVKEYFNLEENKKSGYFDYEIIETPGHKEDSLCFYFPKDKVMFCGDFLFKNGIGRTDLDGGSNTLMKKSLEKISIYFDDIVLYPGHGDITLLGNEKVNFNYYF